MDKVAYGTWQIVQISEINKQQTNSVEYKCSAKSLSRLFKVTRSVQFKFKFQVSSFICHIHDYTEIV